MKKILLVLLAMVVLSGCSLGNKATLVDAKKDKYTISVQVKTFAGRDTTNPNPMFKQKADQLCPKGYRVLGNDRHHDIFIGATYSWTIQCNLDPEEIKETELKAPIDLSPGTRIIFAWHFSVAKSGPGDNFPEVATFRKGDKLTILEEFGKWVKVRSENNQVGWIRNEILEKGYVSPVPEIAWVLWKRTATTGHPSSPATYKVWDIISGFPSFNQCKEAMGLECKNWAYTQRNDDLGNGCPDAIVFVKENIEWMMEFKCLPDTVDPRK